MRYYLEVTVKIKPDYFEMLESYLWDLEPAGIEEREEALIIFFQADTDEKVPEIKTLLHNLKEKSLIGDFSISHSLLEEKNWNEEWEKSLQVIRVTENIVIRPIHREYEAREDDIVLDIIPKMSFGTGDHESTKLMLLALEKYCTKDMKVLDVGSGTAVLAIAAVKLGAESAVAVDNDILCKINGEENIKENNVERQTKIVHGTISDIYEDDFDLVLANIQKNILIEIAGEIKKKTGDGGIVILSGLLSKDEDDIRKIYTDYGFLHLETFQLNEWIAPVFKLD